MIRLYFLSFFLLVTEKFEKTCFHAETNDFDQRTERRVPVCWSKYTTVDLKDLSKAQKDQQQLIKKSLFKPRTMSLHLQSKNHQITTKKVVKYTGILFPYPGLSHKIYLFLFEVFFILNSCSRCLDGLILSLDASG